MRRPWVKTLLVWLVIIGLFVAIYFVLSDRSPSLPSKPFADFVVDVDKNRVEHVRINGNQVTVSLRDVDERYRTLGNLDGKLHAQLTEQGVAVEYGAERQSNVATTLLVAAVVVIAVVLFFVLLARRSAGGGILALGKTKARLVGEQSKARFEDVGGAASAKEDLQDLVDLLKYPKRWQAAGIRPPRGVLLVGPPGCGKTLLARALAGEAGVPFFIVSGSEFVEMFVGVGAARVRDTFEKAAKKAPCVVFIDELDAVGRRRGSGVGSAHDEREQTLNQLLVTLDGFETDARIIVLAATNRPDILDKALLRPGRLDRRIEIPLPDRDQRFAILTIHTRNKTLAEPAILAQLADRLDGTTGADLESLVNEAALLALRRVRGTSQTHTTITAEDFEAAVQRAQATERRFDRLDQLLIESASQLAEPTGPVAVRLTLNDESSMEGELVWADAKFVKVRRDGGAVIVPKAELTSLVALAGTADVAAGEVPADLWAGRSPDLA